MEVQLLVITESDATVLLVAMAAVLVAGAACMVAGAFKRSMTLPALAYALACLLLMYAVLRAF